MSTTIDERVVELRFDSREFERRAQASIGILDRLKKSLDLSGSAKNLRDLQKSANEFDMSALGRSVDMIASRFSNLGLVGVTALQNITNKAIDAGTKIVKALTIDPIKTGFQEYETQIGAIQTILANTQSKGTTLDNVTAALDELNRYADQTIYNFTEMTRNIGTFTAAGVDLEKSVTSIKGIANLAAISGSTSQQASTAMYQLSQALAAGKVSLMDWNSVVNAGMGGEVFQTALKRTARQMGYNVDAIIEKYGSFRESLTEGEWLTTEVLTETLTQLSGAYTEADLIAQGYTEEQARQITELAETAVNAATKVKTFTQLFDTTKEAVQSGWTQSWEYIIGDFNEAQDLLTNVSNVLNGYIQKSADARNETLKVWKTLGGRDELIASLGNAFQALLAVVSPIKEAFRDIFPAKTGYDLYAMTVGLRQITEAMIIGSGAAEKIRNAFGGFFAILDLYTSISWVLLEGGLKAVATILGFANGNILDMASYVGTLLMRLQEWVYENEILEMSSTIVSKAILFVVNRIKDLVAWVQSLDAYQNIANWMRNFYEDLRLIAQTNPESIEAIMNALKNLDTLSLNDLRDLWDNLSKTIVASADAAGSGVSKLYETLVEFVDGIKSKFENIDLGAIITFAIAGGMIAALVSVIRITSLAGTVVANVADVVANAGQVLIDTSGALKALKKSFQADTFVKMATGVTLIAGSIAVLSLLDPTDMLKAAGVITLVMGLMVGLYAVINLIDKRGDDAENKIAGTSGTILAMAGSIAIIVAALKVLETIDLDGIWQRVAILGLIAAGLTGVIIALSKLAPTAVQGSTSILIISTALLVLSSALTKLGGLDLSSSLSSVISLGLVVSALSFLLGRMNGLNISSGLGLIAMVAAIRLMMGVIEDISDLDMAGISKNLDSFTVVFGMFAVIMASSKLAGANAAKAGVGILAMAAALNLIGIAFKQIDSLDRGSIRSATEAVSKILAIFALLTAATSFSGAHALQAGGAILTMSMALVVVVEAMEQLGKLDQGAIDKAFSAVTKIMMVFAVLIGVTALAKDATKTVIAIGAVVTALLAVISFMTLIDPTKLQNVSICVSIIMAALGLLVAASGTAEKSMLVVLSLSAVIIALGGVMYHLASLPTGTSMEAAISMGAMLTALSISLKILGNIPIKAFLIGVAYLATLIAAVAGIYIGASELAQYVDQNKLEAGIELLNRVGAGIGSFFGTLVSSFGAAASASLSLIGENLSSFSENAAPFFDMLKTIDGSVVTGAASLAGAFLAIATGDFVTRLNDFLSLSFITGETSMDRFKTQMIEFGEAIVAFSGAVSGKVDQGAVEACANAGSMLTEIANGIPNQGGALSKLIGDNTLSMFGEELAAFAPSFMEFAKSISEQPIDSSAVESCANAAAMMSEIANGVPNQGGALASWIGDNSLSTFGEELAAFAPSFMEFASIIAGASIDSTAISNCANAAGAMAELNSKIPNQGGVLASWIGDNELGTFGNELAAFSRGFVSFATTIAAADIDASAVTSATNMMDSLVVIANNLPSKDGKIADWFGGNSDFQTFGEQLSAFGASMVTFYQSFAEVDMDRLNTAVTEMGRLVSFANAADSLGDNAVISFANQLQYMASMGVSEFVSEFDNAHDDAELAISNFIMAAKNEMARVSVNMIDNGAIAESITSAFANKTETLKSAISILLTAGAYKIEWYYATYKSKANTLADQIKMAFDSKRTAIKTSIGELMDAAISKIEEYLDDFERLGKNAGDGLINGLRSKKSDVYNASEEMASAVDDGIRDRLDIHSPSKITNALAKFAGAGFIGGLKDNFGAVYDASAEMGSSATSGLSDSLAITSTSGSSISGAGVSMGSALSSGVAAGMAANTSPEEAAREKAQSIADAFQAALNEIDLSEKTADLQYQLWEKTVGLNASDSEIATAQMDKTLKEIEFQQQRVDIAQKIYDQTVSEFGEKSTEAREKYNALLEEMVTLSDLSQQLNESKAQAAEKAKSAYQAYVNEIYSLDKETYDKLIAQGYTDDQIREALASKVGYDLNTKLDTSSYEEAATKVVSSIGETVSKTVENSMPTSVSFTNLGETYASAISTGFETKHDSILSGIKMVSDECLDLLTSVSDKFKSAGALLAEQLIAGMLSEIDKAKKDLENSKEDAASKKDDSPTRWDEPVDQKGMSSGASSTPVIGSNFLKPSGNIIGNLISAGITTAGIAASVAKTATSLKKQERDTDEHPVTNNNYFTQNNYSPKALSAIDIYRQTKNQISAAKGAVAAK